MEALSTTGPATLPASAHRMAGLDGLRGLAIIMVLFHHLTVFDQTSGLPVRLGILAEFCSHGVDLFFVLSGFLIFDRLRADCTSPGWMHRFWIKRTAKIIPCYFAVIAFVFLLLPSLLKMVGAGTKLSTQMSVSGNWPWYATLTSNFLNALDGRFTNPALDVCWSLGIEVQFYLLAALWVGFRGIPGSRSLAVIAATALITRAVAAIHGASWITILVLPWHRLDAFAFGAAITLGCWRWASSYVGATIATVTLVAPFLLPWSREHWWVQIFGYSAVGIASAYAVSIASTYRKESLLTRFFGNRFLGLCGTISYSVYLTHLPVRAALRDILLPRLIHPVTGSSVLLQQLLFYFVGGTICLFLGWLTWRFFEEPARRRVLAMFFPNNTRSTNLRSDPKITLATK